MATTVTLLARGAEGASATERFERRLGWRCGGARGAPGAAAVTSPRADIRPLREGGDNPCTSAPQELFRFDFLVDEDARPVLAEVNLSPNLVPAPGSQEDAAAKQALLRATLAVVTRRFVPTAASRTAAPPAAAAAAAAAIQSAADAPASSPAATASRRASRPAQLADVSSLRGVECVQPRQAGAGAEAGARAAPGASPTPTRACCRLQTECNHTWARLAGPRCLSLADVRMLQLAAAEEAEAASRGMRRIWPARMGTGRVRTLWPVPPREDRLLACWTGAAS